MRQPWDWPKRWKHQIMHISSNTMLSSCRWMLPLSSSVNCMNSTYGKKLWKRSWQENKKDNSWEWAAAEWGCIPHPPDYGVGQGEWESSHRKPESQPSTYPCKRAGGGFDNTEPHVPKDHKNSSLQVAWYKFPQRLFLIVCPSRSMLSHHFLFQGLFTGLQFGVINPLFICSSSSYLQ